MKHSHDGGGNFLTGFIIALILLMAALIVYIVNWYAERSRIAADSARYLRMYADALATEPGAPSQAPEDGQMADIQHGGANGSPGEESSPGPGALEGTDGETPSPPPGAPSPIGDDPTGEASPAALERSASAPKEVETSPAVDADIGAAAVGAGSGTSPVPSTKPAGSPDPTGVDAQDFEGTSPGAAGRATPSPSESVNPEAADTPLPTADADTLVFAMPTKPPVQASFGSLLVANPETIGYLAMGDLVSLPVVQRENDNEFYLNHGFERQEAREGTLFLDGVNRLVPEDECLIVYGHNMKNGTMFGKLSAMRKADMLKKHAIVRFDTLYANHLYVPFAAFYASMDRNSASYFEVRRFLMQPDEIEDFIAALKKRSRVDVPVDVDFGDSLLLLVTCDYHGDDSRFILALRRLRDGESEEDILSAVKKAR